MALKNPEERKAYHKRYNEIHRDRLRNQNQEYYLKNKTHILARAKSYQKEWQSKHKVRLKAKRRARYLSNKERELAVNRKWASKNKGRWRQYYINARAKDPERLRKHCRDSYWRHLEKRRKASRKYSRIKNLRRRARMASVRYDETGIKEWMEKIRSQSSATCYHCGKVAKIDDIEFDHVIPVSRGGAHALDNLCVSCFDCNRSKHDKTVSEWVRIGQQLLSL
jgi:5-methylcytosine-specific restriction endonuclease McrA